MKWLLFGIAGFIALVAFVSIVGLLLPRRHLATRSALLKQPASALFAAVRDFATQPSWRTGLIRVDVLPPRDGRPCYRETTGRRAITYVVLEEKPTVRLVTRIADENLPYGGTWTFEFAPQPEGTRVQITEDGEVKNPVFRFMARFVFGYTSTMDGYLRDLGRKFGETVTPEP